MDGLPSRLSWAASLIVIFALVARAVGGDLGGCDFVGCRGQIRHTYSDAPTSPTRRFVPSLRIHGTGPAI